MGGGESPCSQYCQKDPYGGVLFAQEEPAGWRGEGKKKENTCSAETSKQSAAQMPLLRNTQCEADVYPGQSREEKPMKAREIHIPQTRDFLGEGVAGNGFCKFLLLITTSQTKSEETLSSY